MSIEFRAEQEEQRGGVREVRSARLLGAAVVDSGSYKGNLEVRGRKPGGGKVCRDGSKPMAGDAGGA